MPAAAFPSRSTDRGSASTPRRNCSSLSCIKITAPGYNGTLGNFDLKGIGSKKNDDDDVAGTCAGARSSRRGRARRPAPAPVAAPRLSRLPLPCTSARAGRGLTADRTVIAAGPAPPPPPLPLPQRRPPSPLRPPCRSPGPGPELAARRLADRREQGQRAHRAMRRQSVRLCRQHRRAHPDQHEAGGSEVDRPHPRSRRRQATTTPRSR